MAYRVVATIEYWPENGPSEHPIAVFGTQILVNGFSFGNAEQIALAWFSNKPCLMDLKRNLIQGPANREKGSNIRTCPKMEGCRSEVQLNAMSVIEIDDVDENEVHMVQ